jgi:hypothetical protein
MTYCATMADSNAMKFCRSIEEYLYQILETKNGEIRVVSGEYSYLVNEHWGSNEHPPNDSRPSSKRAKLICVQARPVQIAVGAPS